MRGVLLIALGHRNYFRMAEAMAASIKVNNPELQVCVVTEGNRLIDSRLFDKAVVANEKHFTHNGKQEYIKAKLFMYDLSPFDETIFLDVDQIMLVNRSLSNVFNELSTVDITFSNTGEAAGSVWADIEEVKKVYGDKPFWNFHSEFVFFRKSAKAKAYFAAARKAYSDKALKSKFAFAGGAMADELAFQIAAMQTGTYPHAENWLPNFWYRRQQKEAYRYPYQLPSTFYTYSIGGSYIPQHVVTHYNNLASYYYTKLGLQNPYRARDKRSFLPERSKI